MGEVARLLGTPLMPWQQLVADVGLEINPDTGLLAYREMVVTVMRQSGKSVFVLANEVDRCVSWDEPQRVAYTAQTGWDARRKLIDDHAPVLERSPLSKLVRRVLRGAGNEGVVFKNGARIDVMASGASAGHGRTLDLGVIDEAFDDTDDRREQAILPAMATRPNAQLMVVSTAGTSASTYLRRKVETGRHAAEMDSGGGVAYFEWSVPDDEDIDDPETWWRYMPALGWTISEAAVAHARQTMSDAEFRRGFANQWTEQEHDRLIPLEVWERVCVTSASPSQPFRFGVDVLPDRSAGSIVVCGGGAVELVDSRPGVSWIAERAAEITTNWGGTWVVDGGGPASSIADDLERAGLVVERLSNADVAAACARMYDAIADELVKFRPSAEMDAAVAGVARRPMGDRFIWSRSTSVGDVTPLMAATLAFVPGAEPATPTILNLAEV